MTTTPTLEELYAARRASWAALNSAWDAAHAAHATYDACYAAWDAANDAASDSMNDCQKVRELLSLDCECCDNCHEDNEGCDLCEVGVAGNSYSVCCYVMTAAFDPMSVNGHPAREQAVSERMTRR